MGYRTLGIASTGIIIGSIKNVTYSLVYFLARCSDNRPDRHSEFFEVHHVSVRRRVN